ncbi:MAG TPA: NAD(P)(+) transhydrogenase (Re/Si-specific) subunit beta [Candidatus Limnocylindrales bacterium]|nr:NAD(P)(+) transhydrogenase (Re/Si-specific) subunit beta [Candidatus Limnocylindrales bacterium]
MDEATISTIIHLIYIAAAICFVLGLHLMNSPASARRGNQLSAVGMAAAIVGTIILIATGGEGAVAGLAWPIIVVGIIIGGGAGVWSARSVKMTAMPQLVSIFNAMGGGAACLVAIDEFIAATSGGQNHIELRETIAVILDIAIGSVTFTGSLIAAGKLQGIVASRPVRLPAGQAINIVVTVVAVLCALYLIFVGANVAVLFLLLLVALIFGVTMVMPIGGADMPVVVSLLNSFTGTAVAMAGFVIDNPVLIIAGALVGAAGGILTKLMADAMNRSLINILIGGFGTGDTGAAAAGAGAGAASVRQVSADDAAIQLAYAQSVIIVPGYGLAVAQAQHGVRELADLLEARGVDVKYAIHPVAGRMPGHMNVLLAEANVPYPQLKEMEEINPEFPRADVALVVGANDVTNPAARRPGTPVSGMPILDVDQAKSVVVIKRSMGKGYAGIDNELYTNPKTGMLFADAKDGLAQLVAAVKAL